MKKATCPAPFSLDIKTHMKNKIYNKSTSQKYIALKRCGVQELLKLNIKSSADLMLAKRKIAKKYKIGILRNSDILEELNKFSVETHCNASLRRILRKRAVRTMSGIAPVAALTKPYPCPGKCAYCPTEKNVPQSYLSNEPAVMRAIHCNYNPYKQVQLRLRALEANGHEPTKIELIVIGGTWSVLPEKYKYWYIAECFRGANDYQKITNYKLQITNKSQILNSKLQINKLKKQLSNEQKRNEKAKYKIIGLTLETRPDYINEKELMQMRELGCTRVELGVQAIDDKILKLNKRGHGVDEIARATKLLKNYGFKITYHIMPGLPGSTPAKDLKMFKWLFSDEKFQPDQIKFYPTIVTKGSLLHRWWKAGKYKPYSDKTLRKLIINCKKAVPEYVRIVRLIRDIPSESIIAGNVITNLRQIMKDEGAQCKCIRCRESKNSKFKIQNSKLFIKKYKASGGEEYFISYESEDKKTLYGFCRLRTRKHENTKTRKQFNFLNNAALIRELHVYGELVPVGSDKKIQHAGLGKKLMAEAEKIARRNGHKKIAVISGIGVRGYYRRLGYRLRGSYMVKKLDEIGN
ncbi:tRNA uridine(34) 5-carboxymethylaminomethyl modification radical SAM/GNAT enzyme Elp3 [Patescibacteria group bacterium]|nr:tRNA uridine(34) 5-carboxymethylaminomethyl modification radical SAM/GNAT enzyme Elp3 [Candidatus Falkowbacteria bacterium]MBU3906078.1 tRNA uridine(34) 5-carboxymethylaminomethyl modification radical SAM/GNAT enzyme Elp3 [Patescibacteria group bacterium]MBU4015144.1 tRNA uridine(34) 5-carboxymethylaminomethyl modification radical SAM/GNAT enzyme Elp3 [Patescibacteria group bacterium]MBU4025944.1 tRNA uridine(34) 5-carboxymethylaminomethyl modification radical SAM/GNAT enzyme Elp3 [Patescibac